MCVPGIITLIQYSETVSRDGTHDFISELLLGRDSFGGAD